MRKATLLLSALTIAAATQAQQLNHQISRNPLIRKEKKMNANTRSILQRQTVAPANKGTAVTDRLIGWSSYDASGTQSDTGRYKYSGSRGSTLDNNIFSSYVDYGYVQSFGQQTPYPMGLNRNQPPLKYDTAYNHTNWGGGDYLEFNTTRTYGTNTMAEFQEVAIQSGSFYFSQRSKGKFDYNTSGQVITSELSADTTIAQNGPYIVNTLGYYKYTTGRIAQDSTVDVSMLPGEPTYNTLYTYDGSGNMTRALTQSWTGTGWEDYSQDVYSYTAANKLSIHFYQEPASSSSWISLSVDSFFYTGNNITRTSYYERDPSTGNWGDGQLTYNYYNAANNLDSQIYAEAQTSGIVPVTKARYKYTSYNHYDSVLVYENATGTGFGSVPDFRYKFYYELFNPSAVGQVNQPLAIGASLYPNPAKEAMNIRFKEQPKGAVTVRMFNMMGQELQQTTVTATNNYAVPVSSLPAGNYIAEISANGGSQRISFVKL